MGYEMVCDVCGASIEVSTDHFYRCPECLAFQEEEHIHNNFTCPAHVADCDCEDLDTWVCNPYWNNDCPDDLNVWEDANG